MSYSVSQTELQEPASGSQSFTITITRSITTGYERVAFFFINGSFNYAGETSTDADFVNFQTGADNRAGLRRFDIDFADGQATTTVDVTVASDNLVEGTETFTYYFSGSTNGFQTFYGTILDAAPTVSLSVSDPVVSEGNSGTTLLTYTVSLDAPAPAGGVTFDIATANGTATAGTDYVGQALTGQTIAAGQTSYTFSVTVNGDATVEAAETVLVNISNVTGATVSDGQGSGTILNDDATYSVSSVNRAEGNNGSAPMTFTVTRDAANSNFATTLYAQPVSGTATAGSDFIATTVPVSFAAGQQTATFAVTTIGDTVVEQTETFTVNLYNDAALTIFRASATGTLVNDDTPARQVNGTNGVDLIYGLGGGAPSTLVGYDGNDIYVVRDINDVIVEFDGGGNDIVYSSISYTLNGGAAVENLSTQTNAGTESINLIGNSYAQNMVGNFGNNVINGNGGADTLIGLKGDDTYAVGDAAAIVREAVGEGYDTVFAQVSYTLNAGAEVETLSAASQRGTAALNLTGNEFAQQVVGNFGANVLDGGAGADTLIGLQGADTFRFSTALGAGNVDTIADFEVGVDRIALASSVFTGLAQGTLSASNFVVGTAATTADQRVVYDQTSGQLFFDADGSGTGAAVLFATVTAGTALTAATITVV